MSLKIRPFTYISTLFSLDPQLWECNSSRGYEDNGINAWIKWIPKLDMKNSALQIQHWRPWGKKAYRHVMERNYDFSGYLYKNRGDADYPAYSYLVGNLTFSDNVMINKD